MSKLSLQPKVSTGVAAMCGSCINAADSASEKDEGAEEVSGQMMAS